MSHLHHKVSALIDGELSPRARERAVTHARNCAQCRREIAETLEVKQRVTKLAPVEVSVDLRDLVASPRAPGVAAPVESRPTLLRKVFVGAGSMSAVVIALAYIVGSPAVTQATPVNPPVKEFAADFADSTGLAALSDPAIEALEGATPAGSSPVPLGGRRAGSGAPPVGQVSPAPVTRGQRASAIGDQPAAVTLLHEAVMAPERYSFEGMRVVRSYTPSGVDTLAVEVHHVPGQGTMFDVRSSDGRPGPASFIADSEASADGLEGKPLGPLVAAYDLALDGSQTVDGRPSTVISASQDGQVCARFWVDDATGLLLRRAMYVGGRLVRWSGFTSISTARHGFMMHLPPEVPSLPTTPLSSTIAPALNDKGWTCPERLTRDFHLSFLHLVDAPNGAMHADYTDGLSTVSVFEERGSLDASSLHGFRREQLGDDPLYLRQGLPMVAVWQSGDKVFTVVTDAPEQMAGSLISRFPHTVEHHSTGVTTRIGTGLSRLVSAVPR